MKLPWHTEKRKVARKIARYKAMIQDERTHARGHDNMADQIQKKLDDLLKYYDCLCGKETK